MDLDAVVGDLVGGLGGERLGHRGQDVAQRDVELRLLADRRIGLLRALGEVGVRLAEVDAAGRFIQQGAGGGQLGLHAGEHVVDRGELVDALLELFAFGGVLAGLAVGGLGDADGLRADGDAGAVHEGHDVLDEAALAHAAEFRRDVVELEFAGGNAVDAHLVLDAADDQLRALLADEHGEAASVGGAFLGTRQDQVDLGAAVRDEALHAVEIPLAVGVLRGFQAHGLEVGAGIRLGEVHGTVGFAGDEARDVFLALFLGAELANGVGDVLQTEEVLEAGVGAGDHFGHHRVDGEREIESAVLTGQDHAHDAGGLQVVQVLDRKRMVGHDAVFEVGAFLVDLTGARSNAFARDVADDVQDAVEAVERIFEALGRGLVFLRFGVILLDEAHGLLKLEVVEREEQVGVVCEEIGHDGHLRLSICTL